MSVLPQPQPQAAGPGPSAADLALDATQKFNRGQMLQGQTALAQAVLADPENSDYKSLFIQQVTGQVFQKFNPVLKQAVADCLAERALMHLPLYFAWSSLLLRDPALSAIKQIYNMGSFEERAEDLEAFDYAYALNDLFVLAGLEKLLIKDYPFETLLTDLRRYFLMRADDAERASYAPFLIALARQCFFNEYLFFETPEEAEKISGWLKRADDLSSYEMLVLGCYRPLMKIPAAAAALRQLEGEDPEALIRAQITEPGLEREIARDLRSFGAIRDEVSRAVQEQYEDHPFPRWVTCGVVPRTEEKQNASAGKKILVAGCGTGQQAAIVALRFPLAEVTAIDLSRASLAYGVRRTREIGIENLEFLHGDILEVSMIGKKFDYIACGGVLHHMDSPAAGLAALKDVMAEGGVMRIALYSDLARRDIVKVQNYIRAHKISSDTASIRAFRKDFYERIAQDIFGARAPYFDNFSISECRDLFFHVQEHRFTCLEIKEALADAGLDLLVFAPGMPHMRKAYSMMYPADSTLTDLDCWQSFEEKNPNIFIGMYKFYAALKRRHTPGDIPSWLD